MRGSVFVTGGSGLLGVNWATTVRDRRRVTLAIHRRPVALRNVQTCEADLASIEAIARTFERMAPDLVVHTASMTNVETCEANPAQARHVNVDLAVNVATATARLGIPLVHISTDHLFGQDQPLITETDPAQPTNVYGRTKAEAEVRVLEAKPDALVVRTNFYGWGPRYRQSFSDQIITALRNGEPVTLFRDVIYSPILMEPLVLAIHDLADRKASGIYHVVGDEHMSKLEFGQRVADCFGGDRSLVVGGSLEERRDLVARPRKMVLSNGKASKVLGRRLGGPSDHLALLKRQEHSDAVKEIQRL